MKGETQEEGQAREGRQEGHEGQECVCKREGQEGQEWARLDLASWLTLQDVIDKDTAQAFAAQRALRHARQYMSICVNPCLKPTPIHVAYSQTPRMQRVSGRGSAKRAATQPR